MNSSTMAAFFAITLSASMYLLASSVFADSSTEKSNDDPVESIQVTELRYIEREPGIDDFELVVQVGERFMRIDDMTDDSGYIVFDDDKKTIFSVSHFDRSVLVIEPFDFSKSDSPANYETEYLELSDAPAVSDNNVFNYREYTGKGKEEETCIEVQLVENLMPEVRRMLKNYLNVVSGQQVKMTDNKITDIQTACYFVSQIYNTGSYYDKGLPIQEWQSNGRFKALTSFKKVSSDKARFNVPESYRRFTIDKDSKMALPKR